VAKEEPDKKVDKTALTEVTGLRIHGYLPGFVRAWHEKT
jgi:hypothetical protein